MVDLIKNNTAKIVSFVLGFLVAFVISGYYQKSKQDKAQADLTSQAIEENMETTEASKAVVAKLQESQDSVFATSATSTETMPYDFLKVSDQKAGETVDVAYVKADFPIWVVVHMEKDGKIWNALGARLKEAGEWTGVQVPLLASTVSGSRYWAVLYKDDGDRQFDLKKDFPLKDESGNFIMMPFNVIK